MALILVGPLPYLAFGPRYAPFAKDLAQHPERYRGRDVVLSLNHVRQLGRGWAEIGEPGGSVIVDADPRFALVKDEYLNLRLRLQGDRFRIVEVGRHKTRRNKWIVSMPILAAVALLALARVRVRSAERVLYVPEPPPCPTS